MRSLQNFEKTELKTLEWLKEYGYTINYPSKAYTGDILTSPERKLM